MKKRYTLILLLLVCGTVLSTTAQNKRIWASGQARSVLQSNALDLPADTVTPNKLNSGHALVDLAINAAPNSETFLHGMVRIRNDFGGFWGSGVSFDIRQLYVKGLINQSIRYQVGDINYKLSPYTFYSSDEELSKHQIEGLKIFQDMMHYDMFYTDDHTWRQQGAALDFALEFNKGIEQLKFDLFASRNRPSDFQQQSERVFFGGNATLVQSDRLALGMNYIDLMDLQGTSQSTSEFHNPVITGTTLIRHKTGNWDLGFQSESGISEMYELDAPNSKLRDYFMDLSFEASNGQNLSFGLQYLNVGPQFRSVGAQSKRLDFQSLARVFGRYGNAQMVRPLNQLDIAQDAAIYTFQFNPNLDDYSPAYDNISPYGKATPNRKGFTLTLNKADERERFMVDAEVRSLSEVVGQGGDDLRSFQAVRLNALLNVHNWVPQLKNTVELTVGFNQNSTKRETDIEEANVDLKSTILDLGLKVQLYKNFEGLLNVRQITAAGNELISVRNTNTEVIDYQAYNANLTESLSLIGVRYTFAEGNTLNVLWQRLNWEDDKSTNPAFGMNQFAVVYNLKF